MGRFKNTSEPFDNCPSREASLEDSLGAANDNASPNEDNAPAAPLPPHIHAIGSKRTSLKNPQPYPMHALGPLQEPATAIQDMVQCPDAMAAHSILGVASLAAQGKWNVELRVEATAPLSLFVMTVAKSGERKTAADKLAMKSVRNHEKSQEQLTCLVSSDQRYFE